MAGRPGIEYLVDISVKGLVVTGNPDRQGLSELEIRVLHLVDDGATATQLAQQLGLERRAAAGILAAIRETLGVASTREALEIARSLPGWESHRTS